MLLLFILSPSTSILLPNAVTQPLLTPTITPLRTPPPPQCTTIGPAESNRKPVLPENGPYLFMIGVLCLMPFTPLPIDVPNSMLLTAVAIVFAGLAASVKCDTDEPASAVLQEPAMTCYLVDNLESTLGGSPRSKKDWKRLKPVVVCTTEPDEFCWYHGIEVCAQ